MRTTIFRLTIQYYTTHEFLFAVPPSRVDFVELSNKMPWLFCWLDSGLRIDLARSQWPIVDYMHKASESVIFNGDGENIGSVEIAKYEVWENKGYDRYMAVVYSADISAVVNQQPKAKRKATRETIDKYKNCICEWNLAEQPTTDKERRAIIRRVLINDTPPPL